MMQATDPTGIWVRTPFLSTSTKAPSMTSICPYCKKIIDTLSFSGIGLKGIKGMAASLLLIGEASGWRYGQHAACHGFRRPNTGLDHALQSLGIIDRE